MEAKTPETSDTEGIVEKAARYIGKVTKALQKGYDGYGREMPDPTPVIQPSQFRQQPSLEERVRMCMRAVYLEQMNKNAAEEFDNPDEDDDFDDEDDDPVLISPHTIIDVPLVSEGPQERLEPPANGPDPAEKPEGAGAGTAPERPDAKAKKGQKEPADPDPD